MRPRTVNADCGGPTVVPWSDHVTDPTVGAVVVTDGACRPK